MSKKKLLEKLDWMRPEWPDVDENVEEAIIMAKEIDEPNEIKLEPAKVPQINIYIAIDLLKQLKERVPANDRETFKTILAILGGT